MMIYKQNNNAQNDVITLGGIAFIIIRQAALVSSNNLWLWQTNRFLVWVPGVTSAICNKLTPVLTKAVPLVNKARVYMQIGTLPACQPFVKDYDCLVANDKNKGEG